MPTLNTKQLYVAMGLTTCAAIAKVAISKWKKSARRNENSEGKQQQPLPLGEEEKAIALLQPSFDQAASLARTTLSDAQLRIPPTDQLMMYGLYKQASVGNVNKDKPPSKLNIYATKKFQAWCKFHGMPRHFAMMKYVEVVEHFMKLHGKSSSGATTGAVGSSAMLDLAMDGDDIVYDDDDDEVNFSDDDDVSYASTSEIDNSTRSISASERSTSTSMPRNEISMAVRQSTMTGGAMQDDDDNMYGDSALFRAAGSGDVASLRDLISPDQEHFEIDERDENGQCPLHLAADQGHLECVQILLEAGADPNATDKEGISILEAAVIGGSLEVVRVLLGVGADPDHKDNDGDTPRTCAEDDDNEEMKTLLREAPAIGTAAVDPEVSCQDL